MLVQCSCVIDKGEGTHRLSCRCKDCHVMTDSIPIKTISHKIQLLDSYLQITQASFLNRPSPF